MFHMHKGLLCSRSSYFRAAFDGGFREAIEKSIDMPEDDPLVVERFQFWLYYDRVLECTETETSLDFKTIIGLLLFSEMRDIPALQRVTMDTLILKVEKELVIPVRHLNEIFDNTTALSFLRRFVVDVTCQVDLQDKDWKLTNPDTLDKYYPKEFLAECMLAMSLRKGPKRGMCFWSKRCDYHLHLEGEPRCYRHVTLAELVEAE